MKKTDIFDVPNVRRYIAAYKKIPDKNGNYLYVRDYEFSDPVSLRFLQDLFKIDPKHSNEITRYMINCYVIDEKKAKALQSFVKEILDLEKYNFMLECSTPE